MTLASLKRALALALLMGYLLGASGCASYSHTVIAKPHKEVAAKLQQHLISSPQEISDLEQTLNRKIARFQFSEARLVRKDSSTKTEVFALPTDDGKTRDSGSLNFLETKTDGLVGNDTEVRP